jgi:enoyl-CoA hydratase
VSRIVPAAGLMDEALATAEQINALGLPCVMMIKECVNEAFESGLSTGVRLERHMFQSLFGTQDQKEGMDAFLNKRKPTFAHR